MIGFVVYLLSDHSMIEKVLPEMKGLHLNAGYSFCYPT